MKLGGVRPRHVEKWGERGILPAVGDKGREISRTVRIAKVNERLSLVAPIVRELRASGVTSLRQIAAALNERGIPTPRGAEWQAPQVKRVLERIVACRGPAH